MPTSKCAGNSLSLGAGIPPREVNVRLCLHPLPSGIELRVILSPVPDEYPLPVTVPVNEYPQQLPVELPLEGPAVSDSWIGDSGQLCGLGPGCREGREVHPVRDALGTLGRERRLLVKQVPRTDDYLVRSPYQRRFLLRRRRIIQRERILVDDVIQQ